MTETLLSPPGPQHAEGAPEATRPDRRLVLFGLLGAVLLAAVAVYFLVLHKSPTPNASGAPSVGVPAAHPVPKPSASPSPQTIPATYNDAVGRDPFAPLYTPPAVSPSAAPSGSTGAPASGAPAVAATTVPQGASATGTATPATAVTPQWVELTGQTGTRFATFLVGYSDGTTRQFPNVVAPVQGSQTLFGQDFAMDKLGLGAAEIQEGDGAPFVLVSGTNNRHNFS